MGKIKSLNWFSFLAMMLLMYYLLNTMGLFSFPMRPQRLNHLQNLYADNSLVFNYLLVSSIVIFPFIFLYNLFKFSFIIYIKYYTFIVALICSYFAFKIDLTFLDLMFCYAILGASVKVVKLDVILNIPKY